MRPQPIPIQMPISNVVYPQRTYIYQGPPINLAQHFPTPQKTYKQNIYSPNHHNIPGGILISEEIIPLVPIRKVLKQDTLSKREKGSEISKSSSTVKQRFKKSLSRSTTLKSDFNEIKEAHEDSDSNSGSDSTIRLKTPLKNKPSLNNSSFSESSISKSRSRSIFSSFSKAKSSKK